MPQLSMTHQLLPKEEWTKPDEVRTTIEEMARWLMTLQDVPYLTHLIQDIESEMAEREDLEAMVITKRQKNASAPSGH
jgi:ubiquinol-cytochrome c reductase subunit 7